MNKPKGLSKGLGKGLGALIDETVLTEEASADAGQNVEIEISKIDVFAGQPRKQFDESKLRELADSILQHGVIQPLVLNKEGSRYMIIAGERRFRAARLAGLKTVPAVVKDIDKKQILEISIIENIQREDLNPIEEANAILMLMNDYSLTQEAVSERLGRSRSAIANTLRLLTLPESVGALVSEGELSPGHARALLGLKDKLKMKAAADEIVKNGLSVREAEALVKRLLLTPKAKKPKKKSADFISAEKDIADALQTKVSISGDEEKGKVVIEYYSKEQLNGLYDYLTKQG